MVIALGTLVYLPPPARLEVLRRARELGARLVTLEPVTALPAVAERLAGLTAPDADPVRARARRRADRLRARRTAIGCLGCRRWGNRMPGPPRPRIAACRHPTPRPRRATSSTSSRCACSISSAPGRRGSGAKDAAIRSEFSIPAARYYQMLYALIDSPVALRSDPLLVRRLQRLRDARSRARAARTFRTTRSATRTPPSNGQLPAGPVRRGPRRPQARRRAPRPASPRSRRDRVRLGGARHRRARRRRPVRAVARRPEHQLRAAELRRRRGPGRGAEPQRVDGAAGHRSRPRSTPRSA